MTASASVVSDADVFGREVCRAMNDEAEDGSTLVTRMVDAAIERAVEGGCEGVSDEFLRDRRRRKRPMTDDTKCSFPSDIYEGPMATERRAPAVEVGADKRDAWGRKYGEPQPNTPTHDSGQPYRERNPLHVPLEQPAKTEICYSCGGSSDNRGGDCPKCGGTGIDTPAHDSGATVNGLRDFVTRAALEAMTKERDEALATVEQLRGVVNGFEPPHMHFARVVNERNEARAEVERHQRQWQRLVTRLEDIPPIGLRVGQPVVDREHVIRALDLDKPVPWVDESESDDDRAVYRTEEAELRAEVERLKKQRDASGLAWDEAENAVANLRSRIAALEAVIEAQDRALGAMREHALATVALCAAYSDAGLKFGRRVANDVVVKEDK